MNEMKCKAGGEGVLEHEHCGVLERNLGNVGTREIPTLFADIQTRNRGIVTSFQPIELDGQQILIVVISLKSASLVSG